MVPWQVDVMIHVAAFVFQNVASLRIWLLITTSYTFKNIGHALRTVPGRSIFFAEEFKGAWCVTGATIYRVQTWIVTIRLCRLAWSFVDNVFLPPTLEA